MREGKEEREGEGEEEGEGAGEGETQGDGGIERQRRSDRIKNRTEGQRDGETNAKR